ncbi:MAG: DNA repair protein RadC [Bacteroidota bacterium]|nr:DNA repair protein RadC [Bacteroidota bacterium]
MEGIILSVKELPQDDRPREKLIARGPGSLTDAELLAILLRTGSKGKSVLNMAQDLINKHKNLAVIAGLSLSTLTKEQGIKNDKAAALLAAFEISRRVLSQEKIEKDFIFKHPLDVANYFIPLLRDKLTESFILLCLNSANKIVRIVNISEGNANGTVVHPREIYRTALEYGAVSIIVIHNHPSGNPEASREDILITKKIAEAGAFMQIPLLDHIIIAGNSFTSLAQKNMI